MLNRFAIPIAFISVFCLAASLAAETPAARVTEADLPDLKQDAVAEIDGMAKFTQVMVDSIFSFGELGFQEHATSDYITKILEDNGFEVEKEMAGMPTAWMARWGSGAPVIAFGSDIDGIPKASQKPGVAYHDPIIEGAPGHGEGHNSGQAVNVTAVIVLKKLMEREGISGTLLLWPGVAEEQLGSKAWYVRDGYFKGVDACLFTHVSRNLGTRWGQSRGNGLVSVEYTFEGESAHSAGRPWRGRSALDAVELMNMAMNLRREHLRLSQRTHYVITDGGDQPNVVPSKASVWYYFREFDYENIKRLFDIGNKAAEGAAMMTDTSVTRRILGTAYPGHFNKAIAEAMYANAQTVGLPEWSEQDVQLAEALQKEMGVEPTGLATELGELTGPAEGMPTGGGSDDIGDISWNVPTVVLGFPANFNTGGGGHHWSSAVAMATPIAHKGSTAGAKVLAMTALDLLVDATVLADANDYFENVQTKDHQYTPFISKDDAPATHLNEEIMATFREEMKTYYYDPEKYDTYLEQLGITYPTVREQ